MIFGIIFTVIFGSLSLLIFVESAIDLQKECGKDYFTDIKDWFKATRLGMWYKNRKNGIKILSDRQYRLLQRQGRLKGYIIVEND